MYTFCSPSEVVGALRGGHLSFLSSDWIGYIYIQYKTEQDSNPVGALWEVPSSAQTFPEKHVFHRLGNLTFFFFPIKKDYMTTDLD